VSLPCGSALLFNTSYDEPEDRAGLLEACGLGRWGETADEWLRTTSQDLERPLTQRVEEDFDCSDQFQPYCYEDLQALDRAAAKRKREDDIAFENKCGLPPTVENMAHASDDGMGTGAAGEWLR